MLHGHAHGVRDTVLSALALASADSAPRGLRSILGRAPRATAHRTATRLASLPICVCVAYIIPRNCYGCTIKRSTCAYLCTDSARAHGGWYHL